MKGMFAVYNKNCGHVVHLGDERTQAEELIMALTVAGKWGWRIKKTDLDGLDDDEIAAILRGDRCETCTLDGSVEGGSILFIGKPGSAA